MVFDCSVLPFKNDSVDEILANHLIEHFDFYAGHAVLKEWYRALKPGGRLCLETPDLESLCRSFLVADEQKRNSLYSVFFAAQWFPGQGHKFLFTENQLRFVLQTIGFKNTTRRRPPDSSYTWQFPGEDAEILLSVETFK
jgi:predicted SAM-dependent methyltransferase